MPTFMQNYFFAYDETNDDISSHLKKHAKEMRN